jgi:hypothetical protein
MNGLAARMAATKEALEPMVSGAAQLGSRVPVPSRLRRHWLSTWARLMTRVLATAGLLLAAGIAAASHRGLAFLVFFTAAALVSIATSRAHRSCRRAAAALRFHRAVQEALGALRARGWHLKHGVRLSTGPDDGHLAMTPAGELAFAIKDCPTAIHDFDLSQTQEFASVLSKTGRPYVPICVGAASKERSFLDRGVTCCTPEVLSAELLDAEAAFLASLADESVHNELLYNASVAA